MSDFILTPENYFSSESNAEYMSSTQFKAFQKCETCALAELKGEWERPSSTALLVGSYVDAYFEGTLDLFRAKHPELLKRDGSLKSDYVQAEAIIRRCERDKMYMRYMSGEKQVIFTGEIAGVPFKVKVDSFHPGKCIVDQKIMRDFFPVWVDGEGKLPFVEAWGYHTQGAIYQEIVRQNTGDQLPFFIAGATKQSVTRLAIISIPQETLDVALGVVESLAERYAAIKRGEIEPERCGKCDYCAETGELIEVVDYREVG